MQLGHRGQALLSKDQKYRFTLQRRLDPDAALAGLFDRLVHGGRPPRMLQWIMLNPSKADAETDDHTIRKCMGFSRRLGYDRLNVCNLFALRSTNPFELLTAADPIGAPNNNDILRATLQSCAVNREPVIVAWGAFKHPLLDAQRVFVADCAKQFGTELQCFGLTKAGDPFHPLRLGYDTPLQPWSP